jgi:hypothetical protein
MTKRKIIEMSANLGRWLQIHHPEIRDLSLNGYSAAEIAREINFNGGHDCSFNTKRRAVIYCRQGYKGSLNIDPYQGILTLQENKLVVQAQKEKNRKARSRIGVRSQGKNLWLRREDLSEGDVRPGELEDLLKLVSSGEFCHSEERIKGTPDYNALSLELHRLYPEIPQRTPKAVRVALYKSRIRYGS